MKDKEKKINFEDSLQELETIVKQLEKNEIPLEEAIKAFERSQTLIQLCEEQLDSAEKKLQTLSNGIIRDT
jgi:exodeoxyribonuclease VII small subunit